MVLLHFKEMFFWPTTGLTLSQRTVLAVLSPFYSGYQAVVFFFLLSGFVLALPYTVGRAQPYFDFVLRRIVRIYLPYLAALVLAVAGAAVWHGHLGAGYWGDRTWFQPVQWPLVLQHVLFLGSYDWTQYNVVFWSLVVEMRVSLIFPLLAALTLRMRTVYVLLLAALAGLLAHVVPHLAPNMQFGTVTLFYAPTFVYGILLAQNRRALGTWYERRSRAQKTLLFLIALGFYCESHLLAHLSYPLTVLGASGFMVIAMHSRYAHRLLLYAAPVFLGRISYSLYLVHVPILLALAYMLQHRIGHSAMFFLYLGGSLSVATVFHWLVEAPCIRLSRSLGRRP